MCPNPPKVRRISPQDGHEIKLGGDTDEGGGGAIPPRGPRHGCGYGETEWSNPRHPIIMDTPTMAQRCGSEATEEVWVFLSPATGFTLTGEREPLRPYIQVG